MEKAFQIIKRRIALGGYRLAKIIKNIKANFEKVKGENQIKEFLSLLE
jgi:hypothetical protein